MSVPHRVVPSDAGFALMVPPQMVGTAIAALDAQDQETAEGPPRDAAPPDHGPSFVGAGIGITLLAFYVVAGARTGPDAQGWFRRGSAIADAIVRHHEFWRAVTALTLHSDIMHVTGNVVASLIFVTALGRWLGGGVALLATLLAGSLGNLLTSYIYVTSHNVVGASTSTFGALGVLGGLQFVRRFRMRGVGRKKRALLGIAAALGLLAMLGMGERSDVVAHASGLGFGIVFGVLLGVWPKRPLGPIGQALALAATFAIVIGAWLLAFHHA